MFITLRNLPLNANVKDLKKLINGKCLIQDVIFSELTREEATPTKKITLGLVDECDAAIVFRQLNGLHFLGQPLIVEDSHSKRGPAPGSIPRERANPGQYQPRAMQGFNAKGMTPTNDYYNEPQPLMQEDFGYQQQPMMMTHRETTLDYQPMSDRYRRMPQDQEPMAQRHMEQNIDDRLRKIRSQYDQELNQSSREMTQLDEFNQPRHGMSQSLDLINQPRYQIGQGRPQMNQPSQPRHLTNQARPQISQPRQTINQPHQQINQQRHQINQPRPEISPPRHHMNEPIPYMPNRPQNINQLSPCHDDIPARNHREASRRRLYEDPRNDYENNHHQEPYQGTATGHQVLDWDIPSREVVLEQIDPVWGAKKSHMNPREFELENAPNRMSIGSGHRSRDELRFSDRNYQIDDGNFEQYPNERRSRYIDDDRYHYREQTTHTEALHPTNDRFHNDNYDSPRPMNVNREFILGSPDKPLNRPKEPERKLHRDDKYDDNRKRTHSDARHEERQSSGVGPSRQRQDSIHKRPRTEEIVHSHTSHKIEGNSKVAKDHVVAQTPNKKVSKKPKGKKPTITLPVLGFKKFKFRHIIGIEGFKAFEQYMFANLKSKHVPTTVNHYNSMYSACKNIYNTISKELKLDLRKYAYFMLNYIQLLVEISMGDKIYMLNCWKIRTLIKSFHAHYTCIAAFNEFQAWFENFDELELKDASLKKPKNKKAKVKLGQEIPKPNAYKWVDEEKPSSSQEKPISAQGKPSSAQGKPSSTQEKPSSPQGKPGTRPSSDQGEPSSVQRKPSFAQEKPSSAQGKPSSAQEKPSSAQGKPAGTSMSHKQLGVKVNAQGKQPLTAKNPEANEMAIRKAKAILNLPIGTNNAILTETRSKMSVELQQALQLEMAGIHETVNACAMAENMSLANMRRRFTAGIKRAIANRLMDTHIAVTALVTFSPAVPSGAACNEFFNARHGRVLHSDRQMALVLFTNNHTFTLMCAEKDSLVDGCTIENIIALDINIEQELMHKCIEDCIKSDKANEIVDIVCNNSYFKLDGENDEITDFDQSILDIGAVKIEQDATKLSNSSIATFYNQNELKNGVKIKQESDTNVQETSNMHSKQESNTQTKQTPITQTKQTNTQNAQSSCLEGKSNEDTTLKPQLPIENDIDGTIQDSVKVIHEDEEIFMCDDDLEEFEL